MSIIIKRLTLKMLDPKHTTPANEDGFKTYTVDFRSDIGNLSSKKDKEDARSSLIKLLTKADTGILFPQVFDEKQYHETHSFTYRHRKEKIWRLRLCDAIRIYLYFLPDKIIVILKILAKRKDKLTTGEEKTLEDITKNIIDCYKSDLITFEEEKS